MAEPTAPAPVLTGLPPITFADDATASWMDHLAQMEGWTVTVTATGDDGGTSHHTGVLRPPTRGEDGFPVLNLRVGDALVALHVDHIANIFIY